jgi:hypothetical protein
MKGIMGIIRCVNIKTSRIGRCTSGDVLYLAKQHGGAPNSDASDESENRDAMVYHDSSPRTPAPLCPGNRNPPASVK